MPTSEIIGYIAATLSVICFVPQVIRISETKDTKATLWKERDKTIEAKLEKLNNQTFTNFSLYQVPSLDNMI